MRCTCTAQHRPHTCPVGQEVGNHPIGAMLDEAAGVFVNAPPWEGPPPPPLPSEWRIRILNAASCFASDFLYYDRKDDEELPLGKIDEMVEAGHITIDEILGVIAENLRANLPAPRP